MTEKVPVSVKFDYALLLYKKLVEESTDSVYEGKVVETFQKLNISMTHYTPLFNALREMGCIELLSKGVRGRPTVYRLHRAPERDAFNVIYTSALTTPPTGDTLRLDDHEQRLVSLERGFGDIDVKQVIVNFEKRIKALEDRG